MEDENQHSVTWSQNGGDKVEVDMLDETCHFVHIQSESQKHVGP